jgi:hypothetical protein
LERGIEVRIPKDQKKQMRWILFWIFSIAFLIILILIISGAFFDIGKPTPEELRLLFKAFIVAFCALIASAISAFFSSIRRKKTEKRRTEIIKLYEDKLSHSLDEYRKLYSNQNLNDVWKSLVEISASSTASSPISSPSFPKHEIQKEIDTRVESLKERIEEIENRFPEQSTIDKIASVNDAILATQIENLEKTLKKLEEKLLTRWDVVKIVFQIIAALSALIGVILALITYFGNKP